MANPDGYVMPESFISQVSQSFSFLLYNSTFLLQRLKTENRHCFFFFVLFFAAAVFGFDHFLPFITLSFILDPL